MAKKTVFECDICGKDITHDQFYVFRDYHYRIGYFRKYHMCINCMKRIREELKKENKNNDSLDDKMLNIAKQDRPISREELGIQTASTEDGLQVLNEGFTFFNMNNL